MKKIMRRMGVRCYIISLVRGLVVCIIDHYPLGNQRTEISGALNISEKLGRVVLEPGLSDIASSRTTLVLLYTPSFL